MGQGMDRWSARLALLIAAALLGCAGPSPTNGNGMQTLEGTISTPAGLALPAKVVINVALEDLSRADAAPAQLVSKRFPAQGEPPFAFTLPYDPAQIDPQRRYGLQASLEGEGRLLLATAVPLPAPRGWTSRPIELVLTPAEGFTATASSAQARVEDTPWELLEISGAPAGLGAAGRQPYLRLDSPQHRVQGFGGCNSFAADYALAGASLQLGDIATTKMACRDGSEVERRFLEALRRVHRYAISAQTLTLYGAAGQPILRFRAGLSP